MTEKDFEEREPVKGVDYFAIPRGSRLDEEEPRKVERAYDFYE